MKSAKDKLAQYRKKGFGDELIELLVMQEEDQVFAEELLDALIEELDENKADSKVEHGESVSFDLSENIDIPEDIFAPLQEEIAELDILHGESLEEIQQNFDFIADDDSVLSAEMIVSAYKRNQAECDDLTAESYQPPLLEVIEGGFDELSQDVIPFMPEYALSEDEREFVLARSEFFYGIAEKDDELAAYREEQEVDEFECLNLDETAAPAEKEWFYDEVEVVNIGEEEYVEVEVEAVEVNVSDEEIAVIDLDDSRPAEEEWLEAVARPYRELAEISELVGQAESKISEQRSATVALQDQLNNRDETIIMQGAEMQRLKDLRAGMEAELSRESQKLAETVCRLDEYRQEQERTEQELLTFGNEIELLHGQLFNVNEALGRQITVTADKEEVLQAVNHNNDVLREKNRILAADMAALSQTYEAETAKNNSEKLVLLGMVADMDQEKDELCRDLEEVRRLSIALQDSHDSEIEHLNYDLGLLERQLIQLRAERENLETALGKQSELLVGKDEMIKSLNTEFDKVADRVAEAEKAAELMYGREIDRLRAEKTNLENSLREQSGSIIEKDGILDSLNSELDRTIRDNAELQQQCEIYSAVNARQGRRIRRLEKVREKIKRLEFENNVLNSETVPNLQKDKEDLVELASEEYNRAKIMDELAVKRARRASYTTTLAAAACLMLVLMPILSWNNIETQKNDIKSDYAMQVASIEAENVMLKEDKDALNRQLQTLHDEFDSARQSWSIKLSALEQETARRVNQGQIIQASVEFSDKDYNAEALAAESGNDEFAAVELDDGQYNGVSGIAEYQAEVAAGSMEMLGGKQAQVRAGEGLSQVLWRVYRTSNPEMVEYIAQLNKLPKDRRGQPMLKVDQQLKLPKNVNTAMAGSTEQKRRM